MATITDITPDNKRQVLQSALDTPDNPNSQKIIAKARERKWIQEEAQQAPRASIGEAVSTGLQQGATLGFADELQARALKGVAGADAKLGTRRPAGGGFSPGDLGTISKPSETSQRVLARPLSELVSENRQEIGRVRSARPFITGAAQAVGALPASLGLAFSAPATLAAQTAVGASLGAASTLGESEEKDFNTAMEGAAIGFGFGLAGGAVASTAKVFKGISTRLGSKALGIIKSVVNKAGGPQKVDAAVDVLLSNDVIKGSLKQIAERVEALREVSGKAIGGILKKLDDAGIKNVFSPSKLAAELKGANVPGTSLTLGESMELPINSGVKNQFDDIIATAQNSKFADETFEAAQNFKNILKDRINFAKDSGERNMFLRTYLIVRDSIDDAIAKAAPKFKGNSNIANDFKAAKEAYGAARTAELGIDNSLRSATGNKILGLTDWVAFSKGGLVGPGVTVAKKVLETPRALAAGARGARALGSFAETVGPAARGVTGLSGLAGPALEGNR